MTNNYNINELESYMEIIPAGPATPAKPENLLAKRNLFVRGTSIYMLDSFVKQNNMKISAFRTRINAAIKEAYETAQEMKDWVVPTDWTKPDTPKITIYVNCPDTVIDERMNDTIVAMYHAARNGLTINIKNVGEPESQLVQVLESIVESAKLPPVINSPFRQHQK